MNWISAKDRLPADKGVYIVYCGYGVDVATFYRDSRSWYEMSDEKHCADEIYDVTHWMELPDPPKELAGVTSTPR